MNSFVSGRLCNAQKLDFGFFQKSASRKPSAKATKKISKKSKTSVINESFCFRLSSPILTCQISIGNLPVSSRKNRPHRTRLEINEFINLSVSDFEARSKPGDKIERKNKSRADHSAYASLSQISLHLKMWPPILAISDLR